MQEEWRYWLLMRQSDAVNCMTQTFTLKLLYDRLREVSVCASGVSRGSSLMKCAFRLRCDPPVIMLSKTAPSDGDISG